MQDELSKAELDQLAGEICALKGERGQPTAEDTREAEEIAKIIAQHEKWLDSEHSRIEATLRALQDERKIEQTFIGTALTAWFLVCAPFVTAYAIIIGGALAKRPLSPDRLQLVIAAVCPGIVALVSWRLKDVLNNAIQALNYRHLLFVLLTRRLEPYRAWGFWWRTRVEGQFRGEAGHEVRAYRPADPVHRRTFGNLRNVIKSTLGIAIIVCLVTIACAWRFGR